VREGIEFVCHDVTQEPFPTASADVLFCRFLLTHLHDPVRPCRSGRRPPDRARGSGAGDGLAAR